MMGRKRGTQIKEKGIDIIIEERLREMTVVPVTKISSVAEHIMRTMITGEGTYNTRIKSEKKQEEEQRREEEG